MILTKKQQQELKKASLPLVKWMNENCHPHTTCIVDLTSVELLESSTNICKIYDFLKD